MNQTLEFIILALNICTLLINLSIVGSREDKKEKEFPKVYKSSWRKEVTKTRPYKKTYRKGGFSTTESRATTQFVKKELALVDVGQIKTFILTDLKWNSDPSTMMWSIASKMGKKVSSKTFRRENRIEVTRIV